MRSLPTQPYNGITVFIDAPSRFDTEHLISGTTRTWFNESCIAPYQADNCDIRDVKEMSVALLPSTRYVLLLGSKVAALANARVDPPGYPAIYRQCLATAAFDPQSCNDHRSYGSDDEDDYDDASDRETKEKQPTRHKNYRFWTAWHCQKLIHSKHTALPTIQPVLYPRLQEVITWLNNTTNEDLYLDIETSRLHHCITCIGLSSSKLWPRIYVVPVYTYSGDLAYGQFPLFHKALSIAFTRNCVVVHNGGFDLTILHAYYKFHMPTLFGGSVYDTMIANHRCFPEAEKSLAHVISQWTALPYHKDQNTEAYNTTQQTQAWHYNAKDVYALKPIKDAQLTYAETIPGLVQSIQQGNSSLVPYIMTSLTGLRIDQLALAQRSQQLVRHKNLYTKMCQILTGKPAFNPGSRDQCARFFHEQLKYEVVSRTATGRAALGTKQLYQLQLKYPNPLIPVIIKYRSTAKDLSMLESELFTLPGTQSAP